MRAYIKAYTVAGIGGFMVKMINVQFGNEMWVDDSRVKEYESLGHKVVFPPPTPAKKTTRRKGSAKK